MHMNKTMNVYDTITDNRKNDMINGKTDKPKRIYVRYHNNAIYHRIDTRQNWIIARKKNIIGIIHVRIGHQYIAKQFSDTVHIYLIYIFRRDILNISTPNIRSVYFVDRDSGSITLTNKEVTYIGKQRNDLFISTRLT